MTAMRRIYLAGPLFGIADRHHNLLLARELERFGYEVVLPQKEALRFLNGHSLDLKGLSEDCKRQSMESDVVVANIDGADVDAGTAVEVGMALAGASFATQNRPKVICVRTDFRTDPEQEIGINSMFGLVDKVIYIPAFVSTFAEVANLYRNLANEIDTVIKKLTVRDGTELS